MIYWAVTRGQTFGKPLLFQPLPLQVQAFAFKQIKKIQGQTRALSRMSTITPDPLAPAPIERQGIRLGDVLFKGVALVAAVGVAALLAFLTYKIFALAWPAMQEFGLSFIWTQAWNPNANVYGALVFIYGTLVTSFIALLLATPLSIAIALFLTELAPRRLAAPIATMVELLAAIPSVVLGLWGILVFGPWIAQHLEPWLAELVRVPADLLRRSVPGRACCRPRSC